MKLSLALSFVILAVAAGFGWHGHQTLASVRTTHRTLVAEAATLGISTLATGGGEAVTTKHSQREDKQAAARRAATEFIAFAREMEQLESRGEQPDPETMKRIMESLERILSLDAEQLKIVIAAFRDAPDLKDQTRQGFVMFAIMTLSQDHPQAAISLFTKSTDLLGEHAMMGKHIIGGALANWAKDDPLGALGWVRENGESHADLITDDTKATLLSGVAGRDPELAFSLIGDLFGKITGDSSAEVQTAVSRIVGAARTPEDRDATLAALRKYAATLPAGKVRDGALSSGISGLAFQDFRQTPFESTTGWLEQAGLSTYELTHATDNMNHMIRPGETGLWIDWLGESGMPGDAVKERVRDLAASWTETDYQAAGKWLATAPDSPQKQTAVSAYAEKVFPYEPDIAVQWAQTLPPGEDRDATFKKLHQSMPKNSDEEKAAAAEFAAEHGIKK